MLNHTHAGILPLLSVFGLTQLITSATQTTPTSTSLIDHIYTSNPSAVVTTDVSDISDHY